MLKLFQMLFHGCVHKWNTTEIIDLYENRNERYLVGRAIYLRCEKCGRVKRQVFMYKDL